MERYYVIKFKNYRISEEVGQYSFYKEQENVGSRPNSIKTSNSGPEERACGDYFTNAL